MPRVGDLACTPSIQAPLAHEPKRGVPVYFWNSDCAEGIDGVATIAALGGRMREQSRISVAVAAMLLALSSSPLGAWADIQIAQSTAPTFEVPRESPGADSSEPPSAAVLDPLTVQAVLGREVRSVADENMGRIVDVIVDRSGQVRAGVIDFGGFLGVGSRKIAVDWSILRFGSGEKSDRVVVDLTRAQVKAAPEYKDGKPVVVLGASAAVPLAGPAPASPQ
jgi:hypothetical protein